MKHFFPPLAVLAAILALSLWNARVMERQTSRLRTQLLQSQRLAAAEDWQGAENTLSDSYEDWTGRQTYLHIVTELAKQYGLEMSERELAVRSEAFAIRMGGRSARVAKQFVELCKAGVPC